MRIATLACCLHLLLLQQIAHAWIGPRKDRRSGSSYYISEEVATQAEASRICRLNGWILATIRRRSQQRTLEILANEAKIKQNIWIGLKLYQVRGMKGGGYGEWSDGKPFNVSKDEAEYHNWHKTEPITFKTTTQITRPTCVLLWQKQRWKWDDYYCDYSLGDSERYACEAKEKSNLKASDLDRISKDFITNTKKVKSTPSNTESLSNAVNELLTVDDELHEGNKTSARQVLVSFDEFLVEYDVEKDGKFSSNKTNVEIHINNVQRNDTLLTGALERENGTKNNIQIYLSQEVLGEASSRKGESKNKTVENVQVNAVFYKNPSLFQVDRRRYERKYSDASNITFESRSLTTPLFGEQPSMALLPILITDVLSVDVKNVNMSRLENPLCVTNYDFYQNTTPPDIPDMIAKVNPICAFWDINTNEWSTEGCRLLKPLEEEKICGSMTSIQNRSQRVTCVCDHMTHFSVLLDTTYIYAPKYLTYITIFGCTVSLICLFASIVTILSFSQLRSKTAQQILLQLCITLFMMNILFLVGIDQRDNHLFCTVIAALLHYFLLAAWGWMFVEAIFLFLRLVVTSYNGGVRGKIVPIGGVLAYGLPGLIAGLTVSMTRSEVYLSEKYCWLSTSVLVPSLLVPLGLVLSCNLVIFVCVLHTITFRSKMFRKRLNLSKVRQTLVRAFCMIFILGIPWLFGFFMLLAQTPDAKEVFAVCFTVLNTTQGVAIFFFFCARQEQVRKLWLTPLNDKFRKTIRRVHSSRKQRRDRPKSQQFMGETDSRVQTDDTKTRSMSNERSLVTFPSSQSTENTATNGVNSGGNQRPFRNGWV